MRIIQVGDLVCLTGDYPRLSQGIGIVTGTYRSPRGMHSQGVCDVLWSNGELYRDAPMTHLLIVCQRDTDDR